MTADTLADPATLPDPWNDPDHKAHGFMRPLSVDIGWRRPAHLYANDYGSRAATFGTHDSNDLLRVVANVTNTPRTVGLSVDGARGAIKSWFTLTPGMARGIGAALIALADLMEPEPGEHCADCGAPMFLRVDAHHHTENGVDVTKRAAR